MICMNAVLDREFPGLESDWVSASNAVVEAEAEALDALLEYRSHTCEATRLRMVYALEVRGAAKERMRLLINNIWANPL